MCLNPRGKTCSGEPGSAESAALKQEFDPVEPDLWAVVEAWPSLSEEARRQIREIVERTRVER